MAIRLVAVDVDGTLVTADQRILPCVQQAAAHAEAAGVQLVLCTGRTARECTYVFDALPQIHYAITHTGSMVQDLRSGEILYHCPLSPDDARLIYSHLRRYDGLVSFFACGNVYNPRDKMEHFNRYYSDNFRWMFEHMHVIVDDLDAMVASWQEPVEKFYAPFSSPEECRRAMADLTQLPYFVTGAGFIDLEVMNPNTSKGIALEALAKKLGLTRSEVAAVGDSSNDKAMLDYAGLSVVMANGEEALKRTADYVAPSNEEGGVADVLHKIVEGVLG